MCIFVVMYVHVICRVYRYQRLRKDTSSRKEGTSSYTVYVHIFYMYYSNIFMN